MTLATPSPQFTPAHTLAPVATGVSLDTTGLVNPQCPVKAVKASAPQVADSISSLGESTTPLHNQARRELFVAEGTTHNSAEVPTDHELVR